MFRPRFLMITSAILIAAFSRLIPHPWNFSPLTAMALFSGAYLPRKHQAFILPLVALFLSDLFLGFYRDMMFTYGSFALIVVIGFWLKNRKSIAPLSVATVASSLLFFTISNFGVWLMRAMYPKTWHGLLMCYTLAIPFLQNTLTGDIFYTGLLFGAATLAERRFSILRESSASA